VSLAQTLQSSREHVTAWYETHPSDNARVAAAGRESAAGVFQFDAPASVLFQGFDDLCREVTHDLYVENFEDELKQHSIVPVHELVAHKTVQSAANQAMARTFGATWQVARPFHFDLAKSPNPVESSSAPSPKDLAYQLKSVSQSMRQEFLPYTQLAQQLDEADSRWIESYQAIRFMNLGAKLDPKNYKFPVSTTEEIKSTIDGSYGQCLSLSDQMQSYERLFARRCQIAFRLAAEPAVQRKIVSDSQIEPGRAMAASETLRALTPLLGQLLSLRNEFSILALLLQTIDGDVDEDFHQKILGMSRFVRAEVLAIRSRVEGVEYPFEHARRVTLADHLSAATIAEDDIGQSATNGQQCVANMHSTYFRCVGLLCLFCEQIELALGIPLAADPPTPQTDEPDSGST
jgi:hypothetical protein